MRRRLEHSVNNPMFGERFLECENEKNAQRRLWRAQEHGQRFGPCVARWQIDRGLRASLTRAAPSTRCASAATPRGGWHADNPIGYPTPIAPSPAVSREIPFYASGTALMWGGR